MPRGGKISPATEFKKGQSGNPNGRPKKLPALDLLIAEVLADEQNGITAAEAILKVIRGKAIKGDLKAAEMLLNRAYGKPKESIEYSNPDGTMKPKTTIIFSDGSKRDSDNDTSKV